MEKLKLREKIYTELQQKPENITLFKKYGRLQSQFCISPWTFFFKKSGGGEKHYGTQENCIYLSAFTLDA